MPPQTITVQVPGADRDTTPHKVTVAHAIFRYRDAAGATRVALRGQTLEVPEDEFQRVKHLGTFVPEGAALVPTGSMVPINRDGTPEEFRAWVASATGSDLAQLIVDQPDTEARIQEAFASLRDGRTPSTIPASIAGARQPWPAGVNPVEAAHAAAEAGTPPKEGEHGFGHDPGSVRTFPTVPASSVTGEPAPVVPAGAVPVSEPSPTAPTGGPHSTPPQGAAGASTEGPQEPEAVVDLSVERVAAYLAKYPQDASAVLAAENARVAGTDQEPRKGVIAAVAAAAGSTQ